MCYCGCPYEEEIGRDDCRCTKPKGAECWLNSDIEDPDEYVDDAEYIAAAKRHFVRTGEQL